MDKEKIGKYAISGKPINLLKEDWDLLIVLDACRFDLFKEMHEKYLKGGKLQKATSPGSSTMEWLSKIYKDKCDNIVYVSANPYCNSKLESYDGFGYRFNARDHFAKIVDVWMDGWDNKLTSIHPQEVNKALFGAIEKHKGKRFVAHYIQPHVPYITKPYIDYLGQKNQKSLIKNPKTRKEEKPSPTLLACKRIARKMILTFFGEDMLWRVKKLVTGKTTQVSAIYFKEGWDGIRKAYRQNLDLVLESVSEVVDNFDGEILITADHGEFLGEYGLFGHPDEPKKKENTEVPWFKIKGKGKMRKKTEKKQKEKKKEKEKKPSKEDEEIIRKRLEALGYM